MRNLVLGAISALFVAFAGATAANAALIYVGSWEVSDGPTWQTLPLAYTGQEAAALLFGGSASDYVISTMGTDPGLVNNSAWYSVVGFDGPNNGGVLLAQDYVSAASSQAPGYYYSGYPYAFEETDAASAYVYDNAGKGNINYAFRIVAGSVPEPLTLTLVGAGLAGMGAVRRKRK
jgi:hypothetical protein